MKYDIYNVDDNSKVFVCPRCENEEIKNGDYCHICGAYIINKCYGNGDTDINGEYIKMDADCWLTVMRDIVINVGNKQHLVFLNHYLRGEKKKVIMIYHSKFYIKQAI